MAWDSPGNPTCGTVPFRSSYVVAAVKLDELCEVAVSAQVLIYSRNVPAQPVSRKLKPSFNALAEIAHKRICASRFPPTHIEGNNQFGYAVESQSKRIGRPTPHVRSQATRYSSTSRTELKFHCWRTISRNERPPSLDHRKTNSCVRSVSVSSKTSEMRLMPLRLIED